MERHMPQWLPERYRNLYKSWRARIVLHYRHILNYFSNFISENHYQCFMMLWCLYAVVIYVLNKLYFGIPHLIRWKSFLCARTEGGDAFGLIILASEHSRCIWTNYKFNSCWASQGEVFEKRMNFSYKNIKTLNCPLAICKKYLQNMEVPRFGRNLLWEGLSKEILTVGPGGGREGGGREEGGAARKTEPSPRADEKDAMSVHNDWICEHRKIRCQKWVRPDFTKMHQIRVIVTGKCVRVLGLTRI